MICSKCSRDVMGGDSHDDCRGEVDPLVVARLRSVQLEEALVALIDAVDAKDEKATQSALFVGRGLTF